MKAFNTQPEIYFERDAFHVAFPLSVPSSFPFPSLPSLFFLISPPEWPSNPAKVFGKRCKLPSAGEGAANDILQPPETFLML